MITISSNKRAISILLVVIMTVITFLIVLDKLSLYDVRRKHGLSEATRSKWNNALSEVGLASLPEKGMSSNIGTGLQSQAGRLLIKASSGDIDRWINTSKSLRTAKIKKIDGKVAYLIFSPSVNGITLVIDDWEKRTVIVDISYSGYLYEEYIYKRTDKLNAFNENAETIFQGMLEEITPLINK